MTHTANSDEAPSLLLRLLHGLAGGVAGMMLGWIAIVAHLPGWLEGVLVATLGVVGCILAYRYGSAFWHALAESWPG